MKNLGYILFYFTFQETLLNIVLQFKELQFTSAINIAAFILTIAFIPLISFVIWKLFRSLSSNFEDTDSSDSTEETPFIHMFDSSTRNGHSSKLAYTLALISSQWMIV